MAFDAGELVATIKAGGLQAFESGMTRAELQFRKVGTAAEAQGSQAEAAGRKGAAAAKAQGDAAQSAGKQATSAVRETKGATDQAASATAKQTSTTRQAGTAAADAGAKGKQAGNDTAAAAQKATKSLSDQRQQSDALGRTLTTVGTAALAAFTGAAVSSASLDKQLAQLQALGGYSQKQMEQAGEAALTAGTKYGQTAGDVASAEIELQKAGTGLTAQLGGALPGALTLAAAGQTDVAEATSIAVTAMTQFHLEADQTAHTADLLAAGSSKALGSVSDLGMALKQGGLVAAQYGWSLDDTVGTLAAFANAGLIGSDAGTSLKTALLNLTTPTQQQAALMKQYNLQLYDSQGHFVKSSDLAGQLAKQFGNVDEQSRNSALGVLFGSDAVRAANVLYSEGQEGIQGWINASNDAGYAAKLAGDQQNSLAGDAQKLAAAFQNDLIRAGQSVTPILRTILQTTTGLAGIVQAVPAPVLASATALTAMAGAAALGGGAFLLLLPRIQDSAAALTVLRGQAARAAAADIPVLSRSLRAGGVAASALKSGLGSAVSFLGGPWGLALAAGGLALTAWQKAVDDAKASSDTLEAAAERGAAGVTQLTKAAAQGNNEQRGVFAWFGSGGIFGGNGDVETGVLDGLTEKLEKITAIRGNPLQGLIDGSPELGATSSTLTTIGTTLGTLAGTDAPKAAAAFMALSAQYHLNAASQEQLISSMKPYADALEAEATTQGRLTGKETEAQKSKVLLAQATTDARLAGTAQAATADDQAAAIGRIQGSAAAASSDVKDLAAEIKGLGSATLDARSAQRDLQQAVDDATKQFGKGSHSLDINTQAGRDNESALDRIAQTAIAAAAATYTQTGSIDKATDSMRDSRKEFVDSIAPILGSRDAARKLADQLGLIPKHVQSLVDVKTDDAMQRVTDLRRGLQNVPRYLLIQPEIAPTKGSAPSSIAAPHKALGGAITGGIRGRDSVPIMAMPDEHMWTTREVAAVGGHAAVHRIRASALAGTLSGYASGGAIGEAQSSREAAQREVTRLAAQIARQTDRVKQARKTAAAADKAATAAQDASSKVYGKGTGEAKHQAVLDAREARKDATAAAKAQKAAEDRLADLRKSKDTATAKAATQASRKADLTQTSDDLTTSYTRGDYTDPSSPYSAVDLAFQASRNTNLSGAARKSLTTAAQSGNAAMVKLAAQQKDATTAQAKATKDLSDAQEAQNKVLDDAKSKSDAATTALEGVKSQMQSLADGVAQTIRGFFSLGSTLKDEESSVGSVSHNAGTAAQWDEKVTTVTPGGTTVGAIRSSVTQSANSMAAFTGQLQAMGRMGYSAAVIQDTANLGVEQGSQIAAAFLQGTGDDVSVINAGYTSMSGAAQAAGNFVGAAVLGDQLAVAQDAAATATQNLQVAQDQLTAINTQGAAAIAAADANAAAINSQITTAQQDLADQVSRAISGSSTTAAVAAATAAATPQKQSIQQVIDSTIAALQKGSTSLGTTKKKADGGYREAQIQPAGTNVLWAEQETGGESYIPHALSKRAQSQRILDATARRFGRVTIPMADGGIFGSSSSSSTDARTISGDHFDFSNGTWMGTPDQVLSQAERRAYASKARAVRTAGIGRVNP